MTLAERKTGGYYTLGKKDYFFPAELYQQVLDRDSITPMTRKGDKEFAKWLKGFISDHKAEVVEQSPVKGKAYGAGKGMSGYWAMPFWGGKDAISTKTIKLATVLRAMRTVVSVVDPSHHLKVEYAQDRTSSWSRNLVRLPVFPVNDIADLEECINVMSGFSIHEAWHSIFTREAMDEDTTEAIYDTLYKGGWDMALLNIGEDVRIERLGLAATPGYREYLNFLSEFMWSDKNVPAQYEPGSGVEQINTRAQTFWLAVREAERAEELLTHPSFEGPIKFFNEWAENYANIRDFSKIMPAIRELREYLEIPDDADPPSQQIVSLTACGFAHSDEGLDTEGANKVEDAIEAEVENVDSKSWSKIFGEPPDKAHAINNDYDGTYMASAVILKPRVSNKGLYKPSKSSLVEKARAALTLRKAVPQADTRLMKSGLLDEDELYRLFGNDMRIFKDATVESQPDAAIYLLVDMSGSMGSPEYENNSSYYAVRIAQLFLEGLAPNPRVKVRVLAHTGDNRECPEGGTFYRIWEEGDEMSRLSALYEIGRGDNYDGYAIGWAGQLLLQEQAEQKLLIVLSDGQPAGHGYGGDGAMNHVRWHTDRLAGKGVNVVQVAVGKGIPSEDQAQMFKHYIELREEGTDSDPFATVFRKLTKLLQRFA